MYKSKEQQAAYQRKHYQKKKQYYKDKASERVKRTAAWLEDYKSNLKCERCGECHPACLDFHHKNEEIKEFSISEAKKRGYGKKKILAEISKCIVLCANCHRKHHWYEIEQVRDSVKATR